MRTDSRPWDGLVMGFDLIAISAPTAAGFRLLAAFMPRASGPIVAASVIMLVGLAIGVAWCWRLLRRPEVSRTCVASLAAVLTAACVGVAAALGLALVKGGAPLRDAIGGGLLAALAVQALLVAAIVLGVTGLADVRRRDGARRRGRAQAAWGIGLAAWSLFAMVNVSWHAVKWGFEQYETAAAVMAARSETADQLALDLSAAEAATSNESVEPNDTVVDRAAAGEDSTAPGALVERFEDLNFTFQKPTEGWIKLDPARVDPNAALVYSSVDPGVHFSVSVEKVGVELGLDNDAMVELLKTTFAGRGQPLSSVSTRPGSVNGIDGMHLDAVAMAGVHQLYYRAFLASHRGYCYQLLAFGTSTSRLKIDRRAVELMNRFAVIDVDRIAHAEGYLGIDVVESPMFGCLVDLSGDEWVATSQGAESFPAGEFFAERNSRAFLTVVSFCLPEGADPTVDELLDGVGLGVLADFDPTRRTSSRTVRWGDVAGIASEFAPQPIDAPYRAQLRAVKHEGRAHVFIGWTNRHAARADEEAIARALDRISFFPVLTKNNVVGTPERQAIRGALFNEFGVAASDRQDYELAAKWLADAVRLRPTDEVVVTNYISALYEGGHLAEALQAANDSQANLPQSLLLRHWQAELLSESGDHAAGRDVYEQLFRDGFADEAALKSLLEMQLVDEDVDAALASVEAFLSRRSSGEVERWKGQLLSQKGEHDAAIELFKARRARLPSDAITAFDLAEAHEAAAQYAEALAICAEFADAPVNADEWHVLRGRCQIGLEWFREARLSFQAALSSNPQNEAARQLEAYAAGLLGQGNMAGATVAIEPVPIPAELQAKIDALPPLTEQFAEFGVAESYRVVGFSFVPGEERKSTVYRRVKVFGPEGVDQLSSISLTFDPLAERIFINRLAVHDAEGKLVAEGDVADYYVTDDDGGGLATSDQVLNVPAPQLKPGCTVELVYTIERTGGLDEFGYETVMLSSVGPVQYAAAFVAGAADRIAARPARVESHEVSPQLRIWSIADPPPYRYETDQVPVSDFVPLVSLSDRDKSWEDLGREHYGVLKERLAVDPEVAARARELTTGLTTADEKVNRLARFVQQELQYQGLEFGIRGQMPNPAARVLRAGYGDCKDHSVLLKQLLNAVDVPAELAMVLSAGRVVESLPSLDQFDHMVVYLPEAAPERAFVDCTSKYGDPTLALLPDVQGGHALVLDPEQPRLIPTPAKNADGPLLRLERVVEVAYDAAQAAAADAIVTEAITCEEPLAIGLRSYFAAYQPQERKTAAATFLREYARVTVDEFAIEGLTAPSEPLVLRLKYRVPRAFRRGVGGDLTGPAPAPWEEWWLNVEAVDDRRTPFELRPFRLESVTTLKLPAGLKLSARSDGVAGEEADEFLTWTLGGDGTARTLSARQLKGVHSPEKWGNYYDHAQELIDRVNAPLAFEAAEATP